MVQYTKFRADTRKPSEMPPPNSCDAQVHVFGDPQKYPLRRGGAYPPPPDATMTEAIKMHKALGISRGVVVQATVHGTNHQICYDALAEGGPNYRAVGIIDDTVSDQELRKMHEAGFRGARFNFWKQLNIAPTPEGFLRALDRIKEYGWMAKVHSAGDEWLELKDLLAKVTVPLVIDHMGHPEMEGGADQPCIRMILELLERDNFWVMISNADRFSGETSSWNDALPIAQKLIQAAPDKAIWCTDWPHVQYTKPMPNDAELLEFLYRAAPDPALRKKILVDNPARLFGY